MSIISATVVRGITYTEDSQERILQSKDRLHQLGVPDVTVDIGDQIASEDIQALSITAAKLSSALQDLIRKVTVSVGTETSDAIDVTIQVQDAADNDLSEFHLLECWLSDTNTGGGETAGAPNTAFSVQTGNALGSAITDKIRLKVVTSALGIAVVRVDHTGGAATTTWYPNVNLNGKVYIGDAITINI